MRGLMGWLLLLPLIFAFWLTMTIANACTKKEAGLWRLLGVLASLTIGGICIVVGYSFAIEGFTEWEAGRYRIVKYPVIGWIDMIGGGIMALLGTWTALVGTRKEIELREEIEKLDKETEEEEQNWAKTEAKKILERGEIDDYGRLDLVCNILDNTKFDMTALRLSDDLKSLRKGEKGAKVSSHVVDIIFLIIGIGLSIGGAINSSSVMLVIGVILVIIGLLFFFLRRRYVKKGKFPEWW